MTRFWSFGSMVYVHGLDLEIYFPRNHSVPKSHSECGPPPLPALQPALQLRKGNSRVFLGSRPACSVLGRVFLQGAACGRPPVGTPGAGTGLPTHTHYYSCQVKASQLVKGDKLDSVTSTQSNISAAIPF